MPEPRRLNRQLQFSGFVETVPEVRPEEMQVLGCTLSSNLFPLYKKALQEVGEDAVVSRHVRIGTSIQKRLGPHVKSNLIKLLGPDRLLKDLPGDIPCIDALEVFKVPSSDRRVRLWQEGGLGLRATSPIARGSILGPYRGFMCLGNEFREYKYKPVEGWTGSRYHWRRSVESLAVDFVKTQDSVACLNKQTLHCSGFMFGNKLSLMNDPRTDPYSNPHEEAEGNVEVAEFFIGDWPFAFVVATQPIDAGEEILLDYGVEYWNLMWECDRCIAMHEEDVELARAGGAAAGPSGRKEEDARPMKAAAKAVKREPGAWPADAPEGRAAAARKAEPSSPAAAAEVRAGDDGQVPDAPSGRPATRRKSKGAPLPGQLAITSFLVPTVKAEETSGRRNSVDSNSNSRASAAEARSDPDVCENSEAESDEANGTSPARKEAHGRRGEKVTSSGPGLVLPTRAQRALADQIDAEIELSPAPRRPRAEARRPTSPDPRPEARQMRDTSPAKHWASMNRPGSAENKEGLRSLTAAAQAVAAASNLVYNTSGQDPAAMQAFHAAQSALSALTKVVHPQGASSPEQATRPRHPQPPSTPCGAEPSGAHQPPTATKAPNVGQEQRRDPGGSAPGRPDRKRPMLSQALDAVLDDDVVDLTGSLPLLGMQGSGARGPRPSKVPRQRLDDQVIEL